MFAVLRLLNTLSEEYKIKFEEIITDNGPEFGNRNLKRKEEHSFEKLLQEMGIKHGYTRPYRPQTNGKVERFWRTIEDDLLRETSFETLDELKEELLQYLYYYIIITNVHIKGLMRKTSIILSANYATFMITRSVFYDEVIYHNNFNRLLQSSPKVFGIPSQ